MTGEPSDEIRQQMVAALYGELPPDELSALEARLAGDEALKSEWEELQGARAFLRAAAGEEEAVQFVFLDPAPSAARRAPAARRRGVAGGIRERLAAGLRSPAGGFALATGALLVLIAAGLRVDRASGGWIVHFGDARPDPRSWSQAVEGSPAVRGQRVDTSVPIEPGRSQGADAYVTRGEFADYASHLAAALEAGLDDYAMRGRGETVVMLREVYGQLERRRQEDNEAMAEQIERVRRQLAGASRSWPEGESIEPGRRPDPGMPGNGVPRGPGGELGR